MGYLKKVMTTLVLGLGFAIPFTISASALTDTGSLSGGNKATDYQPETGNPQNNTANLQQNNGNLQPVSQVDQTTLPSVTNLKVEDLGDHTTLVSPDTDSEPVHKRVAWVSALSWVVIVAFVIYLIERLVTRKKRKASKRAAKLSRSTPAEVPEATVTEEPVQATEVKPEEPEGKAEEPTLVIKAKKKPKSKKKSHKKRKK